MGEVHVLSLGTNPPDRAALDRISDALSGAFAEGVNLGPRGPHIRAHAQSLNALLPVLRSRLAKMMEELPNNLERQSCEASIIAMIGEVEQIIELAQIYQCRSATREGHAGIDLDF